MDLLPEIAKQGLGYLLFAGSLVVMYMRERMYQDLIREKDGKILEISEKRVLDAQQGQKNTEIAINNLRQAVEPILEIVRNLQNIANKYQS